MAVEDSTEFLETTVTPRLKVWNYEKKIHQIFKAITSNDGEIIALLANGNALYATHIKSTYEEHIMNDVLSFIWGICDWKMDKDLNYPTVANYLVVVDTEFSVGLFCFTSEEIGSIQATMLTLVGCSLMYSEEELPNIDSMSIICSLHDLDGSSHRILCVVNKMHITQMIITAAGDAHMGKKLALSEIDGRIENRDCIKMHEYKDGFVYLLTHNLILYVLSVFDFQMVKKILIYERLPLHDVLNFGITCIDSFTVVVLIDNYRHLHILKFHGNENAPNVRIQKYQSNSNVWEDMIKHAKEVHMQEGLCSKKIGCYNFQEEYVTTSVPLVICASDYHITNVHVSNSTVLVMQESCEKKGFKVLTKLDCSTREMEFAEIPADVSLSICVSECYPTLFVSPAMISIPMFSTSQEQLIDSMIEYSDIHLAELVCKSNEWNQFSIPLHTLEVGLQHKQLDIIGFFLKSREKVFSHYWNELTNPSNAKLKRGSSTSSSKSYDKDKDKNTDSNEMFDAIEMIEKAIIANSQGKHKQNFFEGLLGLTIVYLNELIQDGVAALKMKVEFSSVDDMMSNPMQTSDHTILHGVRFPFFNELAVSLSFLTEKLLALQTFLRHPTKENEIVKVTKEKGGEALFSYDQYEAYFINGRIGSLQKMLFNKGRKSEAVFVNIIGKGKRAALDFLEKRDIDKAEKNLLNLGLEPDEELRKIYLKTTERSLRDFLHTVMKGKGSLSELDFQNFYYAKEVEELYPEEDFNIGAENHNFTWKTKLKLSLPAPISSDLSIKLSPRPPTDISKEADSEYICNCYSKFSLEHVQKWDERTRKNIILDGIFMADVGVVIEDNYSSELWDYLISHNKLSILKKWIISLTSIPPAPSNQVFPKLPEDMSLEFTTRELKEVLINLLVENGIYPSYLLDDFSELIHYLSVNKILFIDSHPMRFYKGAVSDSEKSEHVRKYNEQFIFYCQQHDLVMLMWHFISHYSISLSSITRTQLVKSWLSMMMSFHDAASFFDGDKSDEILLFKAFSENARYLEDSSATCNTPYTLNEMIRNKQPIIALASILVCRNLFDGAFDKNGIIGAIETSLLEETLRAYPLLHDTIFKENSIGGRSDITMYKLLQDNTDIEVSRLFSWQAKNDLAVKDESVISELPHFSNSFLVERYSQEVILDYQYYLEQCRPMFACYIYMRDSSNSNDKQILPKHSLISAVYQLAIENFQSLPILSSCVLFLDLLDIDSEKLKVDARSAMTICKYYDRQTSKERKFSEKGLKKYLITSLLTQNSEDNLTDILKLLEDTTDIIIYENKVNRFSYEAVCHWQLVISFSRMHRLPLSTRYIEACCKHDNWLQLFLFIHLYQLPPEQVVTVLETDMKNEALKEHLIAIIRNVKEVVVAKNEGKKKKKKVKEVKTKPAKLDKKDVRAHLYSRLGRLPSPPLTPSYVKDADNAACLSVLDVNQQITECSDIQLICGEDAPDNIIDIILICEEQPEPWKMLISYGIALFHPLFSVLAGCYENSDFITCHCVWYICSVNKELVLEICKNILGVHINKEDIPIALQTHRWVKEDLLVVVKCILKEGLKYAKLIVQGFSIFRYGDVCTHFLEFCVAFIYEEEMEALVEKLSNFQSEYEAYHREESHSHIYEYDDEINFIELFSFQCLQVLLSICETQYHLQKLVVLLADVNYGHLFSLRVPNFVSIRKTINIVCKSDIHYPLKKLCVIDEEFDMKVVNNIFEQLLKAGHFEEAKDLSELYCLSQSKIILQKVVRELEDILLTKAWDDISIRCSYFRKIDKQFYENKCSCDLAGFFFENQALLENSAYTYGERALLLLFAMQWYHSSIIGDRSGKLNELEKQVWVFQIKAEVEGNTMGRSDRMPSVQVTLSSQESINVSRPQRTCSDITTAQYNEMTELIQEIKDPFLYDGDSPLLSNEEENKAFERFIGKLLDDKCITEAQRVSIHFQKSTIDLEIVLASIYLAQGNLNVDGLSDNIKSILAETTSQHISLASILEGSGTFSRPENLQLPTTPSGGCMKDYVFIEEIQNALEKLTLRVNYGKECLKRVLVSFKIATLLSISYEDVVIEDCFVILRQVLENGIDLRRQLSKQFIKAFDLPSEEVANFVSEIMINWIKISCDVGFNTSAVSDDVIFSTTLRSHDDIVSLLQLTESVSQVGTFILEEVLELSKTVGNNTRSVADLAYEVELLIYAHHCFTVACDMEGIARILHFAGVCTKLLARQHLHNQMLRLLTGIGRFNEMVYVIETLYNQHHFEILCKQGHIKENKLKMALLDFLKEYHPKDTDSFRIISLGFGMYREMAQHHESIGNAEVITIKDQLPGINKDYVSSLKTISKYFSYAADYYIKDECVRHAHKCIRIGRLAELQIQMLPSSIRVLGLNLEDVHKLLKHHQNFIEAYIVADCYELTNSSIWIEPLYHNVVVKGNFSYLQQYISYFQMTPALVMEIAMIFRADKNNPPSANMKKLITHVRDMKAKLKIAKELNFADMEKKLLDGPAGAYLRDHIF